jgi:4-hydroxybutyrate dehydrogenase
MALIPYLISVHFEFGAVSWLREESRRLQMILPLLVTDPGIVAAGLMAAISEHLPMGAGAHSFEGTPAHPTAAAVRAAVRQFRTKDGNGFLALGGGSPIDRAEVADNRRRYEESYG